jgi:plastocyanin
MNARALFALGAVLSWLALAAPASAADGVQRLHYEFGPVTIKPGQNTIEFAPNTQRPQVDGWIVGFHPNLKRPNGTVPRVDVIHLHHGVWLVNGMPTWAAGEEKTDLNAPAGFGWRYRTSDSWIMNHMIHNLTPTPTKVSITYDLDFIPADSPAAAGIQEVHTAWIDAVGGGYPVFDAKRRGKAKRFTYPDDEPSAPRPGLTIPADGLLVGSGGHLHPGGLFTDLRLTRNGKTVKLFRSKAKYYEPAGAVSWDVSMTVTPRDWRVAVKAGDVLTTAGTYDTSKASWYESMAIMPTLYAAGATGGANPFETNVAVKGHVTHGHLAENDNHGGGRFSGLPDPRALLTRPIAGKEVAIKNFIYGQGDLNNVGRAGRPARVRQGTGLTFVNQDSDTEIWHTITACKAPCNKTTGIAYPLADGPVDFDSGELGVDRRAITAAAQRVRWTTPKALKPGLYTYFCRVHPFMRGSFKVKSR